MTGDEYRPRDRPLARNLTRRQRSALRRGDGRSRTGGITIRCGCRFSYTGAAWHHITPCRSHRLRQAALGDLEMKLIAQED